MTPSTLRLLRFPTLLIVAVTPLATPALSQQPTPTLIRVESELTLVDFLAFDRDGAFVSDLSPGEVQLLVDGRRQDLAFFQLADFRPGSDLGSTGAGSGAEQVSDTGKKVGTPPSQAHAETGIRGPNPIIIVIDLDSMDPSSLKLVVESLRSFLAPPSPGRPLYMLFTIQGGLALRCRLTEDPSLILSAAESLSISRIPDTFIGLVQRIGGIFRTLAPARLYGQAMQESVAEAKIFVNTALGQLTTFTEAAEGLARQLEPLPGRKNVLLFTAGYPVSPSSTAFQILYEFNRQGGVGQIMPAHVLTARFGQPTDETGALRLRGALRELNGSQITAYTVNVPRGTVEDLANAPEAQYIPRTLQGQRNNDDASSRQAFVDRVASSTGGAARDWTAFAELGERVRRDNQAYYLAAFRPGKGRKPGSYSELEIRITRPGIRAASRPGSLVPSEPGDPDREANAVFDFPEVFRDFPISATVSAEGQRISVQVSISTGSLKFALQDGKSICRIRLLGVLVNSSGKWETEGKKYTIAKEFNLVLDEARLDSLLRTPAVTAPAETQAPAGDYELILAASQWPSGLISTFSAKVSVPAAQ